MSDPTEGARRCVRCDEALPDGRSVCPGCGTLQPGRSDTAAARPRTIGPIPVEPPSEPGRGELPGLPPAGSGRRGPLSVPPRRSPEPAPAEAPPAPAPAPAPAPLAAPIAADPTADPTTDEAFEPWDDEPRRTLPTALIVGIVAVLAAITAGVVLTRGDEPQARPDDRVAAVRAFCAAPEGLGPDVPAYDPAKASIAYVARPQPPSSTEPDDELVLQVAPTMGEPVLTLAASVDLVNVALCLEEGATTEAEGTCRYELTTPGRLGEEVERPLRRTSYDATLYELRSGEPLASGPVSTPTDGCPPFAFTDGAGVSAPLTDQQLVTWLAAQVPRG